MSDSTPGPDERRPGWAWLRVLSGALVGGTLLVLAAALSAAGGIGTAKHSLSHTQWTVVVLVAGVLGPLGALLFWAWWRLAGRHEAAGGIGRSRTSAASSGWLAHGGPDLDRPSDAFVDGRFVYQVQATNAMSPMLFLHDSRGLSPGARLFQLLAQLVVVVVTAPFDRRSKVVVSRRVVAPGHLWGVVQVEFFDDVATADARAAEILRNWDPGPFDALTPLTREQLRTARTTRRPRL